MVFKTERFNLNGFVLNEVLTVPYFNNEFAFYHIAMLFEISGLFRNIVMLNVFCQFEELLKFFRNGFWGEALFACLFFEEFFLILSNIWKFLNIIKKLFLCAQVARPIGLQEITIFYLIKSAA
jgi:hypothetical protein